VEDILMPPDIASIEVYCDDESTRSGTHSGRAVRVVTFHRSDGRWIVLRPEKWAEHHAEMERVARPGEPQAWPLRFEPGDVAVSPTLAEMRGEQPDVPEQADRRDARGLPARFDEPFAHTTYKLRCPLCGLDSQRHHDAVAPVLDRLFAAGLRRISLAQLSAMIDV
jgi:hypothetical protein